ncbi:MAG: hypothetical protein ACYC3L_01265 [Gemmatimonadaceae bacterium]
MAIYKLQPGREHAIIATVIDAELAPSQNPKYKPQYRIDCNLNGEAVTLYESQAGIDRQLARLGIRLQDLIGQTWRFSKTPMADDPTKGFINIDRATAAQAAAPTPRPMGVPQTPPAGNAGPLIPGLDPDEWELIDDSANFPQQLALPDGPYAPPAPKPLPLVAAALTKDQHAQVHYLAHFRWYLAHVLPTLTEMQIPVDAGNINQAVATLMIESGKR